MSTIPQSSLLRQELVKGEARKGDRADTAVPSPSDNPRAEAEGGVEEPASESRDRREKNR